MPAGHGDPRVWHGTDLRERIDRPASLLAGIHQRLMANPEARIWTVDEAGQPVATTYVSLWPRASAIAEGLRRADVVPGQTIAALTGTVPDTVAAFWACLMGGWTFLPLTGRARRARDLARPDIVWDILSQLPQAPTILTAGEFAAEGRLPGGAAPLDLALIEERGADGSASAPAAARPVCWLPTSGTTGRDKLAGLNEKAIIARYFASLDTDTRASEVRMWVYDPDSGAGLNAAYVARANRVQVSPASAVARPLLVMDLAAQLRVRRIGMTCSLARLVTEAAEQQATEQADQTWDLSALSQFAMGGERVDPVLAARLGTLLRRFGATGVRVTAGYGTTETGPLVSGREISADDTNVRLGGPAAGVSLRIIGDDGAPVPEGELGIVEVSAPDLMFAGYADAEGEAAGFRPDGWWRTGDLGRFTEGRLSLHGRVNEVISVGGRKVALADVDAALGEVADGTHRVVSCPFDEGGGEALGIMVYGPAPLAERDLRRAVGERCGIQPVRIGHLPMDRLPLGATGKLVRRQVAEQLRSLPGPRDQRREAESAALAQVWRACLPRAQGPEWDSHFFADGGDSLAAHRLFAEIESRFDVKLRPGLFFADPTFGRLSALVEGSAAGPYVAPATWALPPALQDSLVAQLDGWPGERPSDRLMAGLNTAGTRPPLFWVCQSGNEFAALAGALGVDQPLYGFRSGQALYRYDENTLQMVALRYVQDVLAVSPDGPLFIGGNCQGGRVALAVAQHLMRREVDVPLLILMEWGFQLSAYSGPVLFLHGRDSMEGNPWLRHAEPERAWRLWLRDVTTDVIPGRHGLFFERGTVGGLAAAITRHLAVRRPPVTLSRAARSAQIALGDCPRTLHVAQTLALPVTVRNSGNATWPEGLFLGNQWLDRHGRTICRRDGRETVPALDPGASHDVWLHIRAPRRRGPHSLVIDMVDEGGRWFDRERLTAPVVRIEIGSRWGAGVLARRYRKG